MVSTHSRPKAAGGTHQWRWLLHYVSTHSRPKAAGSRSAGVWYSAMFQHTAARRRLEGDAEAAR